MTMSNAKKKYKILMVDQTHTLAMDYMVPKINSKRFLLNDFHNSHVQCMI